jgi:hypothetical protein
MTSFERLQTGAILIAVAALFPLLGGSAACAATPLPVQAVAALPDDHGLTYVNCATAKREFRTYGATRVSFARCDHHLLITVTTRGEVVRAFSSSPMSFLPQSGPLSAILSDLRSQRTSLTLVDGSTLSIPPSAAIASGEKSPIFGGLQP